MYFFREINQNEVTELSLTKNAYGYPPKPAANLGKFGPKSNQDEVTYSLSLLWEGLSSLESNWKAASGDKIVNKNIPTVSVQLSGNKGISDVMSVDLKKIKKENGKTISALEVFDAFLYVFYFLPMSGIKSGLGKFFFVKIGKSCFYS